MNLAACGLLDTIGTQLLDSMRFWSVADDLLADSEEPGPESASSVTTCLLQSSSFPHSAAAV